MPDARPQATPARVDVLGVGISAVAFDDAVATIDRFVAERRRTYVTLTGVHGVMEAQRSTELLAIHNRADLTCPDGMPMVWAAHWAGIAGCERVYGPDLLLALCAHGVPAGWRHYFYGGAPGVADRLAARLAERFPGLEVAGTWCPPFRPLTSDEERAVIDDIDAAAPDLVWVGLSTPKQERWMAAMRDRLEAPVLLGVGAAFDLHAGLVPQAPAWMQARGLEWAFRLAQEPRRLGKRYLVNNPGFAARIVRRPPRPIAAAS